MSYQDVLALTSYNQSARWNTAAPTGTPVFVTYSFGDSQASYDTAVRGAFSPWTEAHKAHVRQALDTWAAVSGIVFLEVPDSAGGQIRFAMTDLTGETNATGNQLSGYGYYPSWVQSSTTGERENRYDTIGGDIFLHSGYYAANPAEIAPGIRGYSIVLHEIGHAIGFKHPFSGDPVIDPARDNGAYTVMSYDRPRSTTTLGTVDIEASQYYYGVNNASYIWNANTLVLEIFGTSGDDVRIGTELVDILRGLDGNDTLRGGPGSDQLFGGPGMDILRPDDRFGPADDDYVDGGAHTDTVVYAYNNGSYSIVQFDHNFDFVISGPGGSDTLYNVERVQFDNGTFDLPEISGKTIDPRTANPNSFMDFIRDYDGNDLGGNGAWERLGVTDINGDGGTDVILVNAQIGRWASVAIADDGKIYMANHNAGGDTRVVGIYIDPLIALGEVEAGGPHDSQVRFQHDLYIGNIGDILGAGDYNNDGLQEIYFAINDGTAFLHAYMHADGNIQYANYQVQSQVETYMMDYGVDASVYNGWFA